MKNEGLVEKLRLLKNGFADLQSAMKTYPDAKSEPAYARQIYKNYTLYTCLDALSSRSHHNNVMTNKNA